MTVSPASAAPGRLLSSLAEQGASKLLAVAAPGEGWRWVWPDRPVVGGDRLALVAPRAGLVRVLRATKSSARPVTQAERDQAAVSGHQDSQPQDSQPQDIAKPDELPARGFR